MSESDQTDADAREGAAMQDRMKQLTTTLAAHTMTQNERSRLSLWADRVLPWRTYIDWEGIFQQWMWLWTNPEEFENGTAVDEWKGKPDVMLFELGVIFGIDYEQAYPEGRNNEWPIPVEERGGDDDDGE